MLQGMSSRIPEISDLPIRNYVSRKGRFQMMGTPWKMALTAIVTFAITFSTVQFSNSKNDPRKEITKMGAVFLSSGELIRQTKTLKQKLFWVGPLENSVFTAIVNSEGVGTLFYWPPRTSKLNPATPGMVVRTYSNLTIYSADVHPLNLEADIRSFDYPTARMVYGIGHMDYQTFFFSASDFIAEIHYAVPQTEQQLLAEADNINWVR